MTEAADRARGGPRRFVKQKVIADRLGVHRSTITRWMDAGEFPFLMVAGQRKITEELYEAWLVERSEPGNAPE